MTHSEPVVSVVVATRNRAALLPRLVDALERQDLVAPYEIVVVDDGSTDGTPAVLAELARTRPRLRVVRQDPNRGPAAARNLGWRSACAGVIAFTDDDCAPEQSWLRHLRAALDDADLAQGRTLPDPHQADSHGPFSHSISVTSESGHYETCNAAYRRTTLDGLGGFDEAFAHPTGEDVDLALRAKAAGARAVFADAALVYHDVIPSSFTNYMRMRRRRAGFVLACRRHPELRRELSMRMFTHPNAVLLGTALGAAMVRPRRGMYGAAAGALLTRYTLTTMQEVPPPRHPAGWLAVIPMKLVADLYEVSVTTRASIRYRTLVI